jgi:nitrogenase subunit NifH
MLFAARGKVKRTKRRIFTTEDMENTEGEGVVTEGAEPVEAVEVTGPSTGSGHGEEFKPPTPRIFNTYLVVGSW